MRLGFPDGLDARQFLRDYWQKQPLVLRAAFDPSQYELDADGLAGLALEPDVEGRLIVGDPRDEFEVSESPFAEAQLTGLPESDWTLLVQDVDKHWPELGGFCALFDFIPRWRFDDLMISIAAPGGGVGPHIDQYDVFLCQHSGQRRWEWTSPGDYPERAGAPLRQIEGFEATGTALLNPGDILYMPPGAPHDGVATTMCSTWSVGFRAPTRAELLAELDPDNADPADPERRYSDPDLQSDEAADGRIGARALARFAALLGADGPADPDDLARQLGRFLTTPKPWLVPERPDPAITGTRLSRRLESGEQLLVHGMALLAQLEIGNQRVLFASGKAFLVPPAAEPLADQLCCRTPVTQADASKMSVEMIEFLLNLYNAGQLMFASDYHDI